MTHHRQEKKFLDRSTLYSINGVSARYGRVHIKKMEMPTPLVIGYANSEQLPKIETAEMLPVNQDLDSILQTNYVSDYACIRRLHNDGTLTTIFSGYMDPRLFITPRAVFAKIKNIFFSDEHAEDFPMTRQAFAYAKSLLNIVTRTYDEILVASAGANQISVDLTYLAVVQELNALEPCPHYSHNRLAASQIAYAHLNL